MWGWSGSGWGWRGSSDDAEVLDRWGGGGASEQVGAPERGQRPRLGHSLGGSACESTRARGLRMGRKRPPCPACASSRKICRNCRLPSIMHGSVKTLSPMQWLRRYQWSPRPRHGSTCSSACVGRLAGRKAPKAPLVGLPPPDAPTPWTERLLPAMDADTTAIAALWARPTQRRMWTEAGRSRPRCPTPTPRACSRLMVLMDVRRGARLVDRLALYVDHDQIDDRRSRSLAGVAGFFLGASSPVALTPECCLRLSTSPPLRAPGPLDRARGNYSCRPDTPHPGSKTARGALESAGLKPRGRLAAGDPSMRILRG